MIDLLKKINNLATYDLIIFYFELSWHNISCFQFLYFLKGNTNFYNLEEPRKWIFTGDIREDVNEAKL